MIKIYGIENAPPLFSSAGRCLLLLEELGINYEKVGLKFSDKQHKSDDYLKINPNGKIPTMVDEEENGFTLWESMAINKYLARKYNRDLLGKDDKEMSLVDQWTFWYLAEYQTPLLSVLRNGVMLPEEKRDANVFETDSKKLMGLNKIIDSALEGKDFLVGEHFTLADLHVGLGVSPTAMVKMDLSEFKNLDRWLKSIVGRPAFQKLQSQSKRP